MRRTRTPSPGAARRGLTLLEVVLAVGIFFASMAAFSQLIANGSRAAVTGQLESQAVLLCESRMAEVVAGAVPMQAVTGQPYVDGDGEWQWGLQVGAGPYAGLLLLEVTVANVPVGGAPEVSVTLRRYVRDPQLYIDAAAQAAESDAAGSTGSAP